MQNCPRYVLTLLTYLEKNVIFSTSNQSTEKTELQFWLDSKTVFCLKISIFCVHFAKSHLSFFFSNLQNKHSIFFSNLHRWQIWNVNMTWFFFQRTLVYRPWSLWWNCGLFSSTFLWRKRFEAIYWSHLLSWFGCQAFVSKPQEFGSHVILRDFPKTIRRE